MFSKLNNFNHTYVGLEPFQEQYGGEFMGDYWGGN